MQGWSVKIHLHPGESSEGEGNTGRSDQLSESVRRKDVFLVSV